MIPCTGPESAISPLWSGSFFTCEAGEFSAPTSQAGAQHKRRMHLEAWLQDAGGMGMTQSLLPLPSSAPPLGGAPPVLRHLCPSPAGGGGALCSQLTCPFTSWRGRKVFP